jgi:hypothetical protein
MGRALTHPAIGRVFVRLVASDQRGNCAVVYRPLLAFRIAEPNQHFAGKSLAAAFELEAPCDGFKVIMQMNGARQISSFARLGACFPILMDDTISTSNEII